MAKDNQLAQAILLDDQRAQMEGKFRSGLAEWITENYPAVERSAPLSPADFKAKFRDQNRPVIFEGLTSSWTALKSWNFSYLKQKCGAAKVTINPYDRAKAFNSTFAEFVTALESKKLDAAYLQEWHALNDCPSLGEDIGDLPIREYDFKQKIYGQSSMTLWVGQKNNVTILHRDLMHFDVIMAQVYGRKLWTIFGPDAEIGELPNGDLDIEKFVKQPNTTITHCILSPGDVIYLPANWYHRVFLLDDCISVGLQAIDEKNLSHHIRDRLQDIIPLALNADYIKEHYKELYQISVRRNMSIAKALGIDLNRLR